MTIRRARALALLMTCAAAILPGVAAAQSFVPQPQTYLLSTDPSDARALWVQPAGLTRRREASISALFTANRNPGGLTLGQYGFTLASGVLALGWQHDQLTAGAKSDVFVVGLAGGTGPASIGFDHRWYRGTNTKDGSWDLGGRYAPRPGLELSLVWRDISTPVVVGDTIFSTLVTGAALKLLHDRVRVGADWEVVTKGWSTSALRVGATAVLPANFTLSVRGEFTGRLSARGLAVGLTWSGRRARVAAFESTVRAPDADRVGLWGAAVTDPFRPRRRRFGD